MRRLIKILIVTLFTITISNVYAFSDPITVEINGNSVLVKNNDDLNIIGSNYVSYDGSKLTINEGTTIKKLKVDKSIEITSNNKEVILGEVVHTNNNLITITYNNLNSVQSEISFNASSSNTYHIITNSTINNYLYVNGYVDKSDDGYGLIIKDSIIDCNSKYAEQYVYGAILVENTKYNGGPFHSEHNTITFKDSDITSRGYMYIEPPEGAFYIYNSKVTSVDSSEITIYVSVDNVENNDLVVVDDSDLTNVFIRNNQNNKTRIVNSNFINTSSNTMEL
nr:hypothetical protein [Bacilli bacterium]